MSFEFNPADEDPHGECRHEIEQLTSKLADAERERDEARVGLLSVQCTERLRQEEIIAKIGEIQPGIESLKSKLADAERRASEESAIVDRVWKALGIANYEQAGGLSIDQHVTALRDRVATLRGALEWVSTDIKSHFSEVELVTSETLVGSWKERIDAALEEAPNGN